MRSDAIPVKTTAGTREITRHEQPLSCRARAMLIAICGDLTVQQLRQRFNDIIDADHVLDDLHQLGLIEFTQHDDHALREDATSEQLARALMAEVATVAPGLNSYLFTLRMRACESREQLCSLLPSYHELLAGAVGETYALKQSARVGLLLASP